MADHEPRGLGRPTQETRRLWQPKERPLPSEDFPGVDRENAGDARTVAEVVGSVGEVSLL